MKLRVLTWKFPQIALTLMLCIYLQLSIAVVIENLPRSADEAREMRVRTDFFTVVTRRRRKKLIKTLVFDAINSDSGTRPSSSLDGVQKFVNETARASAGNYRADGTTKTNFIVPQQENI